MGRLGGGAGWPRAGAEPSLSVVVEWGCGQPGGSGSPWVGEGSRSERIGRAKAGRSPRGVGGLSRDFRDRKSGTPSHWSWRFLFLSSLPSILYLPRFKRSPSKLPYI